MPVKSIVIANIAEFNRRGMIKNFSQSEYDTWDNASTMLSEMSLFWRGDDKIVVLPAPPNETYVCDLTKNLNYRNLKVVWPRTQSYSICEDILEDTELFKYLSQVILDSNLPSIISWGATSQLYNLVNKFKAAGLIFETPELPEADKYWTSIYFDSKSGFREFFFKSRPFLNIPNGFTCGTKDIALDAIGYYMKRGKGFVLKANYGTGGFSTMCYSSPYERGYNQLRKEIEYKMAFDHFWDNPPVIIEEFIGSKLSNTISLTIDLQINNSGTIELLGAGKMIIRRGCLYSGIRCGKGVLEPSVEKELISLGTYVGEQMSGSGYRGCFDVDFVQNMGGDIFLTEINARRASPLHVFEIATQLLGNDWQNEWALYANDHFNLQEACNPTYYKLNQAISRFNLENERFFVRVLPTIISFSLAKKNPYMGYVLLASNDSEALKYAEKFEEYVMQFIGMPNRPKVSA